MRNIISDLRTKNSIVRVVAGSKSFTGSKFFTSTKPDSDTVKYMKSLYGQNTEIKDNFDVRLSARCSNGTFVGRMSDNILSFKGIPYAKPPVGTRRWQRPEKNDDSDRIYEAYYFGSSPIQTLWFSERGSCYNQSEDCLYLNIWTNTKNKSKDKPVMVFIHGGSYGWGGTSDPIYDGHNFVNRFDDIVLVTIGYRTGIMGFIDFSSVNGGNEFPDAPNLGILDQIAALKWICKNIHAFGGNAENVTVFGESAGGGSASLLPVIDEAKGLFKRVIAESGSVALTFSQEECQSLTHKLLKETGCKDMHDLMALSEQQLVKVNEKLNQYNNFPMRDGKLIPTDPYKSYENGVTKDIDMMIGTNADEARYWIREVGGTFLYKFEIPVLFENNIERLTEKEKHLVKSFLRIQHKSYPWSITEFYNEIMFRVPAIKQAFYHSKNGGNSYMYYWNYPSAEKNLGACHAVELAYVFNNLNEKIYTGDNIDKNLAERVQKAWVNFARTGNPQNDENKWPKYDGKDRKTKVFDYKDSVVKNPKFGERVLIEPLLYHYFNGSYAELNFNVPSMRRINKFVIILAVIVVLAVIACKIFL